MPHTTTTADTFSFLDLPCEIRDRIYYFALTRDQAFLWPAHPPYRPSSSSSTIPLPPLPQLAAPLLRTCRQISTEALPILYTQNRFSFTHPSDLNIFTHIFSPKHVRLIPRIGLHVREKDLHLWHAYLHDRTHAHNFQDDAPGLQYLMVFLVLPNWPNGSNGPPVGAGAIRDNNYENALAVWPMNPLIRRVCSLFQSIAAETTVLASARIGESAWNRLHRALALSPGLGPWNQSNSPAREEVAMFGVGVLRTRTVVVDGTGVRVCMEVFCPGVHEGVHAQREKERRWEVVGMGGTGTGVGAGTGEGVDAMEL